MGAPKQLLDLGGRPLLQHVLDAAAAAPVDDIVVVLGAHAAAVRAAVTLPAGARFVVNEDHAAGQAGSLRAGLAAAPPGATAAVVLLGDQPEVRPAAVAAVVAEHARAGAPVVRAAYRGRASHPVLLDRAVWSEAAALTGDQGARALIARHAGRVALAEVGGDPPADIDTPEDHAALRVRRPAET